MIGARRTGPLFLTARAARVQLPPAPRSSCARLSYLRPTELFEQATADMTGGPFTLHQLRPQRAHTHAAEDGASAATLLSGHTSVTSLAR